MSRLLDSLTSPEQLQTYSDSQRKQLADELREMIIQQVSATGGHLASNLGIVELTIALLSVFDFRQDQIVFDVGHQCYAWKILTGRMAQFKSLRQKNGLSGFPKRSESPYDFFDTGHSSTSISAALGLARANKIKGQTNRHAIAVIGDGALTGGMAFEALNDAGSSGDRLLVILNDNQMSIHPNVGGLARHLEHLRVSRRYLRLKIVVERWLRRIPLIGLPVLNLLRRLKQLDRLILRQTGVLFEQLGFRYYGPIDGHDSLELRHHLTQLEDLGGPVLLHVVTQKGRGYAYAESSPELYHGVAPFEIDLGVCSVTDSGCHNYSDVFGHAVLAVAHEDPRVCAISAAMTAGTGLLRVQETYPHRFFDVGIAEQHALTLAAGLAAGGARPIVALYSTFLQRAYDQLLHDVCLQKLPVVIGIDRAGIVGEDGETHQGIYDLNLLLTMPHIEIICPADAKTLAAAVPYALNQDHPVAIRYPRGAAHPGIAQLDVQYTTLQVVQGGEDCTLAAVGTMLSVALDSATLLAAQGIRCEVVSVMRAKPFDESTLIESARKTGHLLFIEETVVSGCLGQTILPGLIQAVPTLTFKLAALRDEPLTQGKRAQLLADQGLDPIGLSHQVLTLLHSSRFC